MASITTRAGKGSPLTHNEVDANFTNLNTDKAETAAPTFTGQVKVAAGSAAAPGVAVTGDLNTGIYSPGADQVAISTGGSGRLFVDSSGRVGIGTASPGQSFSISSPQGTIKVASTTTTNSSYQVFENTALFYVGVDNSSGSDFGASYAASLSMASNYPMLFKTSNTERLRITAAGLVGIGTSAPGALLHLRTSAPCAILETTRNFTVNRNFEFAVDQYAEGVFTVTPSTALGGTTFTTPALAVTGTGRVGIGTTSPVSAFKATFSGDYGIRIQNQDANQSFINLGVDPGNGYAFLDTDKSGSGTALPLRFAVNSAERMRIDTSGRVGIGTTSPGNTLHLAGTNGVGQRIENTSNSISAYSTLESSGALQANISGSGFFSWVTGGGEKVRIDNSGNVGIGTTSPDVNLVVSNGGTSSSASGGTLARLVGSGVSRLDIVGGNSSYSILEFSRANLTAAAQVAYEHSTNSLYFTTNGTTERARIDSSGRVGIGTSSVSDKLEIANGTTDAANALGIRSGRYLNSGQEGAQLKFYSDQTASWLGTREMARIGTYGLDSDHRIGSLAFALKTTNSASNPTEMMRLTPTGLGIGVTGSSALLHVNSSYSGYGGAAITDGSPLLAITGGQNKTIRIDGGAYQGGTSTANLHLSNSANSNFNTANGYLLQASSFDNGSTNSNNFIISSSSYSGSAYTYTERLRIDSSGRLLVGTSSARGNFFGSSASSVQVEGNSTATSMIAVVRNSNDADGPTLLLGRTRSTGDTIVQNGDRIGRVVFQANDGANFVASANIEAFVDGTPGANDMPGRLVFSTTADGASSPTERVRITSAGLVGIGTSTPGHTIDVAGTGRHFSTTTDGASLYLSKTNSGTAHQGGNKVYFTNSGPAATGRNDGTLIGAIQFQASQPTSGSLQNCGAIEITADGTQSGIYTPTKISFSTANNINSGSNVVAMTIDSSQRVGIGTTPDSRLHVQGLGSASGYTSANNAGVKVDFGTGNNGVINLVGGAELGIYRSNSSGAYDVGIGFGDNSNRILRFDTAGTERFRCDSSGRLLVGTSSNLGSAGQFQLKQVLTTGYCSVFEGYDQGGTAFQAAYRFPGGSLVGSITSTSTATAFNTSSDYRLKENVTPVTDGITRLQQLKPSRFNFIADPSKTVDGFIAHEVQAVVPEAITGEKDAVDDDGNPVYQGIDQSKLVPLLTAALQEAIGEIESLKARVAALEAS